jgi:outer membrane protein assembly factor BamB
MSCLPRLGMGLFANFVDSNLLSESIMPATQNHFRLSPLAFATFFASIWLIAIGGSPTMAQLGKSQSSLERAGLTSLWFTSAELGAGGKIVDWALDINRTHSTTYIRIQVGSHREVISEHDLDAFGKPLGLDRLVEEAEFRKSILEAELAGQGRTVPVELHQYTLPKSTIYILGSNSRITAIDADSGRHNWSVAFGLMTLPNMGIHADDFHVAAINGSTVYCFEASSGKSMWSQRCKTAVAAPPVVLQGKIFVPLIDGRLEIFEIAQEGFGSYTIVASGVPTARPLVTSRVIAWPTDIGHLNFTATDRKLARTLIYRLIADGYIHSTPTYREDYVFTGSADGFVYAIEEHTGKMLWQTSLGAAISQSPFVFGDSVFAITNGNQLFSLNARTGEMRWNRPLSGIGKYLGASRDKIYVTNGFRSLLVVEPYTGTVLSSADIGPVNFILPNRDTDRLYVATNTGVVHCVHELGSPIPYFHPDKIEEMAAAKRAKAERWRQGGKDAVNPIKSQDERSDNPFETDDSDEKNPFAEGEGDDDNPFATGDGQSQAGAVGAGGTNQSEPDDDDPFK